MKKLLAIGIILFCFYEYYHTLHQRTKYAPESDVSKFHSIPSPSKEPSRKKSITDERHKSLNI